MITGVVVLIPSGGDFRSSHTIQAETASALEILIGLLLLVAAYAIHRRPEKPPPPDRDYTDPTPAWLVRLVGGTGPWPPPPGD